MNLRIQRLLSRLYRNENDGEGDGGNDGEGIISVPSGEVVGTGNDTRLAFFNKIADQNEALVGEDFQDVNNDGTTSPFRASEETSPDDTPAAEDPPAQDATPPVVVKHKIKVNGQELELTLDELVARAQKVEAADQHLAEAARLRREAEAAAMPPAPKAPTGPTAEELQRQRDAEDREIIRGIQMGTEEEALAALRRLEQRAKTPSLKMDEVSSAIDERLAFNEAIRHFQTAYADIAGDPVLNGMAAQRDQELLAKGDRRSYIERYDEIGKGLRAWLETKAPKPALETPPADPMANKKARKDAAPKPVTNATQKVAAPAEEEDGGEESPAEVIAAMRKARGGPGWMRA